MGRGQTTAEFAAENGELWAYAGGNPGDPGWVSDEARFWADECGLDAEKLDDLATDDGWEFHDKGYGAKIEAVARKCVSERFAQARDVIAAARVIRAMRRGAGGINPDAAYRALDAAVDALDEAE